MDAVTEQELLEEVRKALEGVESEDDAITTKELAAHMGIGVDTMQKRMPALIASGQFEVCQTRRQCWNGRSQKVPAIRRKQAVPG